MTRKQWDISDELDTEAYGINFYNILHDYCSKGKLSEDSVKKIIEALVDADEIRDTYSSEIKALLFSRVETGLPVKEVLEFLRYCCELLTAQNGMLIKRLFSIMQGYVDEEDAFSLTKRALCEGSYPLSRYTIFTEDEGEGVLYNTLYQSGVLIERQQVQDIKRMMAKGSIAKIHPLSERLREKHFVMDDSTDEDSFAELVRLATVAKKSRELTLTIKTTMDCNLRCAYCWQTSEKGIITEDVAQRIIRMIDLKAKECTRIVISWFGGEPMLGYERILEIMDGVTDIAQRRKLPYVGLMSTNGTLLNARRAEQLLKRHVYTFQITLDGMKERHDASRPFANPLKSSFDTIVANLRDLRDHVKSRLLEVIVRVNMTPDFMSEKEDFLNFYLKEFGKDRRFKLIMQQVTDRGGERIEEFKQKKALLDSEKEKEGLVKDLVHGHSEILYPAIHFQHGSLTCEVQNLNSYNINPDGTLYFCDLLCDHGNDAHNLMGFIGADGRIVYKNSHITDWKIPKRLEQCKKCEIYPLCFGGLCPVSARQTKNCNYADNLDTIYNALIDRKFKGEIKEKLIGGAI